ncbi:LOW QUALITY PROTEIN: hypothetical protein PAHAL_2G209000 [Panicum hallii]|uniref:Uncharacterized protein n=1 Tax=Panicum hallii TaxID=206008 RepID=A0A270R6D0_9POAL|nr:LOW QUALITY PROTEIN: hypothetical protein PAHAL_2G209000 [Panicum hallii]
MKEIRSMRALLDRCLLSSKKGGRGREPPPEGCLAVYVGAARERFVVRAECVNHRLFRALLEEAEEARGPYCYAPDGPLELPCDAAAFARAVASGRWSRRGRPSGAAARGQGTRRRVGRWRRR